MFPHSSTRFILLILTVSIIPVMMIGILSLQSLQHHDRLVNQTIGETISIVKAEQIGQNVGLEKITTALQEDLEKINRSSKARALILITTTLIFLIFGIMMPWVFLRVAPFQKELQGQDQKSVLPSSDSRKSNIP